MTTTSSTPTPDKTSRPGPPAGRSVGKPVPKSTFAYFRESLVVSVLGLLIAGWVGWMTTSTRTSDATLKSILMVSLDAIFVCSILSLLEISLSFDNAVVNANTLKKMTRAWHHRFLTWGMLIAVFGMRLVFPLAIVGFLAHVGPIEALTLAAVHPDTYAELMRSVQLPVAAFGGSFLILVALKFFIAKDKTIHWVKPIEKPLSALRRIPSVGVGLAVLALIGLSHWVPPERLATFYKAGLSGVVVFILVDGISSLLERELPSAEARIDAIDSIGSIDTISSTPRPRSRRDLEKASAALFIYLEVLDASFSFDGVVGAFAITNNLFIITIGLGIGALFVRSLTVLLVERGTLLHYRYIEHGAFYAIGVLALIMFASPFIEIPEILTGVIGALLIGCAFLASIIYNRTHTSAPNETLINED